MARAGPPAYAWDWFARQRLPWREARARLVRDTTVGARYRAVDVRGEIISLLRADYPREERVRTVVHDVVAEVVFLGRTSGSFAELGARSAPRGLRWWWTAVTGEDLDTGAAPASARAASADQLALDDVHTGYGDA